MSPGNLTKSTQTTYIPGNPGYPAYAGSPYRAAYCTSYPVSACEWVPNPSIHYTWTFVPYDPFTLTPEHYSWIPDFAGYGGIATHTYACTTTYHTTCYPAVAAVPGYAGVAATPSQILVSLNVGWNSHSRTIATLDENYSFNCTVNPSNTGLFLGVDGVGKDDQSLTLYPHGLLIDPSGAHVYEAGVIKHTLVTSYNGATSFRIERRADNSITYRADSSSYVSTTVLFPGVTRYVYGQLYSGNDNIISAEFAVILGLEQFASSAMAGAGTLHSAPKVGGEALASSYVYGTGTLTTDNLITGSTYLRSARLTGIGTLVVYGNLLGGSYLLTSLHSGSGTLVGGGVITYDGVVISPSPFGFMSSGVGDMTVVDNSINGTAWLEALNSIASESGDYSLGVNDLAALTMTASSTEVYVPQAATTGYGLLPLMASTGFAVSVDFCQCSVSLPAMLSVGGDYVYGIGSAYLPAPISWADEGSQFEMLMMSGAISYDTHEQQPELVLIINSEGVLQSVYTDSVIKVQEYITALETGSVSHMYGDYGMSQLSGLRVLSLETMALDGAAALGAGRVWVVTMETGASTQYDNYGFNSFFVRNGESYGVADDGIYRLSGSTDLLAEISAQINLGSNRLGVSQDKALPAVYINAASDGKLIMKVEVDGSSPYYYEARSSSTELDNHRVDTGRGLKGNNWTFTLMNQNGDDFELANLEFVPLQQSRRV